jgi:cytochrome c553
MQPIAAGLDAEARRRLADHYASLPGEHGAHAAAPADEASIARGREIALRGVPERGIPSCKDCHGPGGAGHNPAYPGLPGQYASYIVLQLELFKERRRGGSPFAHLMDQVAPRLTPEEMRDVAAYYASLPPAH